MPTYEYICHNQECLHEFETFQSMKADSLVDCPECEKPSLKRKIGTGAGIIFKGSGFYETDYKTKSGSDSSKKNESKKADSKPAKTEAKKKDS